MLFQTIRELDTTMDLIIIGNGVAGLSAALRASRLGLKTMVIGQLPLTIPTGGFPLESVHPGLESLLERIGGTKALAFASRSRFTGIKIDEQFVPFSPEPEVVWEGHHLSKSAFTYYLEFQARKADIHIIVNDPIRHMRQSGSGIDLQLSSGQHLKGKYLIDASGSAKFGGRHFKLSETFYSKPLTASSGTVEFARQDVIPYKEATFISEKNGFTWLAPEHSQRYTWTRLRTTSAQELEIPSIFSGTGGQMGKTYFHNVRWRCFDQVATNSTFLIGDAAGILDPGTGQGILLACWTAISAVDTITQALEGQINPAIAASAYNDWFNDFYHHRRNTLQQHYAELGISLT